MNSDPTLQMVSAPRLTGEDVLFVLSFSGRTSYLISNIEIAKKAGARIVSISPGGSIVASLADGSINLNAYRASTHPLIVPTGRAPMYVMLDVLFFPARAQVRGRHAMNRMQGQSTWKRPFRQC